MKMAQPVTELDNKKVRHTKEEIETRKNGERSMASKTRYLKCPDDITKEAQKEWRRLVRIDDDREVHLLYDSDTALLEIRCELWSAWKMAQKEWFKFQNVIIKNNGKLQTNPFVSEMQRIADKITKIDTRLGNCAQGRAQIVKTYGNYIKEKKEDEDWLD